MSRLAHLALVLWVSTLLAYAITDALPGDAALAQLGEAATAEQLASLRAELGLDRPWPARYADWLLGTLRGDLGASSRNGAPIAPLLLDRALVSAELMLLTQCLAVVSALALGLAGARWQGTALARAIDALTVTALSTPSYVFAILLITLFAIQLGWLPASGFVPPSAAVGANLRSLLLPALALALVEIPVYTRVLRRELVEVLEQPFVRTARAYGADATGLLLRHGLRPASLPFVTVIGLNVGHLIAGAVVIESIFALPGMGRMLLDAVQSRDLPTVQACVLVVATAFVCINLLVDAAYAWLDPRVRRATGADA